MLLGQLCEKPQLDLWPESLALAVETSGIESQTPDQLLLLPVVLGGDGDGIVCERLFGVLDCRVQVHAVGIVWVVGDAPGCYAAVGVGCAAEGAGAGWSVGRGEEG